LLWKFEILEIENGLFFKVSKKLILNVAIFSFELFADDSAHGVCVCVA
jgi:hypothetical protein